MGRQVRTTIENAQAWGIPDLTSGEDSARSSGNVRVSSAMRLVCSDWTRTRPTLGMIRSSSYNVKCWS